MSNFLTKKQFWLHKLVMLFGTGNILVASLAFANTNQCIELLKTRNLKEFNVREDSVPDDLAHTLGSKKIKSPKTKEVLSYFFIFNERSLNAAYGIYNIVAPRSEWGLEKLTDIVHELPVVDEGKEVINSKTLSAILSIKEKMGSNLSVVTRPEFETEYDFIFDYDFDNLGGLTSSSLNPKKIYKLLTLSQDPHKQLQLSKPQFTPSLFIKRMELRLTPQYFELYQGTSVGRIDGDTIILTSRTSHGLGLSFKLDQENESEVIIETAFGFSHMFIGAKANSEAILLLDNMIIAAETIYPHKKIVLKTSDEKKYVYIDKTWREAK